MRSLQTIIQKDFDSIENIIFGGDFNCPLNPAVDKRGGNLIPRRSVINAIEQIQSERDLHDIWRIKNPTMRSYTWSQSVRTLNFFKVRLLAYFKFFIG